MTSCRAAGAAANWPCLASAIAGVVAALALSFASAPAQATASATAGKTAAAKVAELSAEDKACLECHARPEQPRMLPSGEKLSLVVSPKAFAQSVHGGEGCVACHSQLEEDHDKQPREIASRRALALELKEQCADCHKKAVTQYEDSVHSALVRTGSEKAPLCSDCHHPHAGKSLKDQAGAGNEPVVCQKCHEGVAKAFAQSVHGSTGDEALACKDCHRTHNVKAAAFADNMRKECLSCHKETAATHAEWLPNADRHLEAISCPACHTPDATRRVNLRLYEGAAPHQSSDKVGVPKFVKLANWANGNGGLDARALWSMLQEFNQNGSAGKMVLRGRLEVQTGEQAHQLAAKALAVRDCDTCHRQGATSFQAVTVSMAGPDGRPLRHEASKGVLTSVESIGSIGGFYAIGSTRIKLLDWLLLTALAAGIALPGAHLTMKLLSRRQRAKAAAAQQDESSGSKQGRPS